MRRADVLSLRIVVVEDLRTRRTKVVRAGESFFVRRAR